MSAVQPGAVTSTGTSSTSSSLWHNSVTSSTLVDQRRTGGDRVQQSSDSPQNRQRTVIMPSPVGGTPFSTNLANSNTPSNQNAHHHHHHHQHQHSNSSNSSNLPMTASTTSTTGQPASALRNSTAGTIAASNEKGRRLIIVRHGERVDFTFNVSHESWVSRAFDAQGRYKRFNINMPRTLPNRKDGFQAYATDTPLTEIGYLQAKLTGRALKEAGTKPTHVYVSSAYRCVQTCVGILKGMQSQSQNVSFNIEPGLFEWGAWFRPKLPSWMTPEEYASQGYPVNVHYKPVVARTEITASETLLDYYNRSYKVVQRVLERHPEDCVILLVAHGASLDTCTRQVCGGAPRSQQDFYAILHQTPYLAMAAAAEDVGSRTFRVTEPPILPFQHQGNASYDWRLLPSQTEKA